MKQKILQTESIILRTRNLGDSDRLVTMLSRNHGKFVAVARGARKAKSKLAAGVDIFSYSYFNLYRGKAWPIVTGYESIRLFNCFREDLETYYYGLYLAELTDLLVSGEESCPDVFFLLLEAWILLSLGIDRPLLSRAYELKLAAISGYSPCLSNCIICGSNRCKHFSARSGGLVCSDCLAQDSIEIDNGTIALARRIVDYPLAKLKQISLSAHQKEQLKQVTTLFMNYYFDIPEIKSRRLLPE